jgi:hypothetical protein
MVGLVQSTAILRFDFSWVSRRRWRVDVCTLWIVESAMLSDISIS